MSSSVNILKNMVSFDNTEQFDGFSKVRVIVSDEIEYSAGTDTGRTLTLNCPWGTQEIANNILHSIRGFQYQPMTAEGAIVDPSVEIGDGISANGVYSGVYSQEIKFNSNLPMNISAPADEELNEEHPYVSKQDRKVTRELRQLTAELKIQAGLISAEVEERKSDVESVRASLNIQSDEISAKVSSASGSTSTFGWALKADHWAVFSNSKMVLKVNEGGLEVNGIIRATGGEIGGFKITTNSLTYNNQTWGGTNTTGIYIGPNGIQLGKAFKVDSAGNLEATTGTFSGYVKAGSIQYGGDNGTVSGSALTSGSVYGGYGGPIQGGSITTYSTGSGINTSLGYADFANGVFNEFNVAPVVRCATIRIGNDYFKPMTIYYTNANGGTSYATVLGYR